MASSNTTAVLKYQDGCLLLVTYPFIKINSTGNDTLYHSLPAIYH